MWWCGSGTKKEGDQERGGTRELGWSFPVVGDAIVGGVLRETDRYEDAGRCGEKGRERKKKERNEKVKEM